MGSFFVDVFFKVSFGECWLFFLGILWNIFGVLMYIKFELIFDKFLSIRRNIN